MTEGRRVTGRDVARHVGVTQSTVSLVLSGKAAGRVSEALQATIRSAAADLHYQPLQSARALRSGRTAAIGLLVPDVTNPFLGLVMHGAQQAAWEAGYAAVLMESGRGAAHQRRAVQALRGGLVDGVLLFGMPPGPGVALPATVLIEARRRGVPAVVLDSAAGMSAAAGHLADHGHRRIGYLGLAGHRWAFDRRERDLVGAVRSLPAADPVAVVRAGELTIAAAAAAVAPLLRGRTRPSALVCGDDILAAGAYAAVAAAGLAVPADLSVVGYAGTLVGEALIPALTTVQAPGGDLGARAVGVLLDRLGDRPVPERTALGMQLVERGSVARRGSSALRPDGPGRSAGPAPGPRPGRSGRRAG